jgi:hypothetical protein
MTSATVKWVLEVDAPLEEAWQRLAGWSDGRNGAPITSVTVPPGELGPTARGGLQLKRLGPNRFPMSGWEPPGGWGWVGGLAGSASSLTIGSRRRPGSDTAGMVGRAPWALAPLV